MARRWLMVGILMVVAIPATAQRRSGRAVLQPNPCRVRIIVFDRDSHTPVEHVLVQLMDAVGFASASSEKNTDSAGQVEFQSWTGSHRFRVRGTEIDEYSSDFEIAENESFHLERIAVVRKEASPASPSGGTGSIPALRLKVPAKARKEFDKGQQELKKERWAESRSHFQSAIDLYADFDAAYYGLGVAASSMKDTEAARRAFLKAIELNPNFAQAQRSLAGLYLSDQKYAEALPLLKRSLVTEPSNAWALTHAAHAELQTRQYQDAIADVQKVHSLPHGEFANVHMIAGYAWQAMGEKEKAAAEFRLYLQEDPKGPNVERAQRIVAELEGRNKPQ